ncbi:hypothetical protein Tco_0814705 [Tanacetum coccineum]
MQTPIRHRYAISSLTDTAYRMSESVSSNVFFKLQNACLFANLHQAWQGYTSPPLELRSNKFIKVNYVEESELAGTGGPRKKRGGFTTSQERSVIHGSPIGKPREINRDPVSSGERRLKKERVDERLLEKIDISFALTINVHVILTRQKVDEWEFKGLFGVLLVVNVEEQGWVCEMTW